MVLHRFVLTDVFLINQCIHNQGSKPRDVCSEKEVIHTCLHVCDMQEFNIRDIPESK